MAHTFPAPPSLPETHRAFIGSALGHLRQDARLVGVAAGGSYASDTMDEHSDLDLVIAVEPAQAAAVMAGRRTIAATLGPLLAAFTGEHVGEPRLLICLYGDLPLHVDLKFVALPDVAARVEDPVVLWERDGRMTAALSAGAAVYPQPDGEWIEERFWIWIHYGAQKIARGELLEAVDFLAFLRTAVLGPLALQRAGARPQGVRRIETAAPEWSQGLQATLAEYDPVSCVRALRAAIDLYRALAAHRAGTSAAEDAALHYLSAVEARVSAREA